MNNFDDKFQITTQIDVDDSGRATKAKMVTHTQYTRYTSLLTHDIV